MILILGFGSFRYCSYCCIKVLDGMGGGGGCVRGCVGNEGNEL